MARDDQTPEEVKELEESLKALVATREKDLEVRKKLNAIAKNMKSDLQTEIEFLREEAGLFRKLNVELNSYNEQIKAAGETEDERKDARQVIVASLEKEIKALEDKEKEGKLLAKQEKEDLKRKKELSKILEENKDDIEAVTKAIEEMANASAKIADAKEAAGALGDEFGNTAGEILGIQKNWNEAGLTGRMLDAVNKGSSLTDVVTEMKKGFVDMVNPTNMLATSIVKLVKGTKQLTGDLGEQFGQFKETTGGGDEYLEVLADVGGEVHGLGIDSQLAAEAVGTLYKELAMFSRMSKEARTELSTTIATLEAFNVSAADSAKAADILMQSVGYTKDEFIGFEQSLKSMSSAIGVPMSTLHAQFSEGADIIGKYGKKGVEEFKKLATAAKATGIEMNSLLEIAGQFDTFEDAAERVGSLNAILGGAYFDTVQMVNATEEERIDILRRGVQATGKSFDQLGRYEKKAIAAAAGINDINEANKLFGTSTAAYAELQMLASDASMSLADLSDEAFNTLGPMQKFETIMKKLQKPLDGILKLLDMLASLLYYIVDGWEKMWKGVGVTGDAFTYLNGAVLLLTFGILKFWKVVGLGGKLFSALAAKGGILGKVFGGVGKSAGGLAKPLGAIGRAAKRNKEGFLALGAAALMMGLGIAAAAVGFAQLVKSFKGLDAGEIVGALLGIVVVMGGIVLAILAIGAVSTGAVGPTWAFAAAILAIGGAVALAAYGISLLVDSFSGLVDSFTNIEMENLLGLIGAVATLASLGLLAGLGLAGIAVGIGLVAAALLFIRDDEIDLLTKLFNSVGSVKLEAAKTIKDLASNLETLTDVTIPVKLSTFMGELGGIPESPGLKTAGVFMKAVSQTSPAAAKAAEGVMKEAATLAQTKTTGETTALLAVITKLLGAVNKLGAQPATAAAGGAPASEFTINLDGKKVWKGMVPYIEGELGGKR